LFRDFVGSQLLETGAVLAQKFWGIAPSALSSPKPEKYELHIGLHLKSVEFATY